jgi:two-component system, sensor histidine kinase PdtaS
MKKNVFFQFVLFSVFLIRNLFSWAQPLTNNMLEQQLKKATTSKSTMETLMALCKNYSLSDLSKASQFGKDALTIANQLNDEVNKKEILKDLISCGLALNEYENGIELMQEGLKISRATHDKKNECDFLYLAGMLYRKKEKDSLVQLNFNKALALSKEINYSNGEGNSLRGLGLLYEKQAEKVKSRQLFLEALLIGQKINNEDLIISTLLNLGSSWLIEGDHQKALNYYIQSVKKALQIGNLNKITEAYGNLSIVYKDIGDKQNAIETNIKALVLCKKTKNKTIESLQYDNLAACYNELKNYKLAMKYARLGLARRQEINDPKLICYSTITIANIYKDKGNFSNALEYYTKGLAIGEKIRHNVLIGRTNIQIADVLLLLNNPLAAKKHLHTSLKILNKASTIKPQITAYKLLAEACFQVNEKDSAYFYLQQHIAVKDSVVEEDRNNAISKMQVQFETKEKETQIEFLEKEAVLQASLLKKNKQLKTWYLLGLMLFCLLAFLFYNRSRLKQNNNNLLLNKNREIEEKNTIIKKSLTEKETLLKEIHHRVKNNLQIISSLLNIQSENIQDENVLSSIQEGQSRVQAMSLIHQNLYQSDELTTVDIQNYLQQLLEYLSNMFVGDDKNITINLKANNINFDIDTAIPLGLIVNELVSNAYKYAFDKHGKGTIDIEINAINKVDFELKIKDDGKGFPDAYNPEKGNSLGLKLVKILSRQLRGKFTTKSDNGALFIVNFKDLKMYNEMN